MEQKGDGGGARGPFYRRDNRGLEDMQSYFLLTNNPTRKIFVPSGLRVSKGRLKNGLCPLPALQQPSLPLHLPPNIPSHTPSPAPRVPGICGLQEDRVSAPSPQATRVGDPRPGLRWGGHPQGLLLAGRPHQESLKEINQEVRGGGAARRPRLSPLG